MSLFDFVGQIFKPAADLIDNLHTSQEEKLVAKAAILQVQADFLTHALDYENRQLEARAKIIEAEGKSEHWLTAAWRPITMLTFLVLVVAYWFGLTPEQAPAQVDQMFGLIQLGLGGYVIGRSAEKIVPTAIEAMKSKERT